MKINRGEIWEIKFFPSVGAEIQKIRPGVVMNTTEMGRLPLQIVVPITDWKTKYASYPWIINIPHYVENGLQKDSGADAFQVKSISNKRFVRKLGILNEEKIKEIVAAISLCIGA